MKGTNQAKGRCHAGLQCLLLVLVGQFTGETRLRADQLKIDKARQVVERLQGAWIVESDLTDGERLDGHPTVMFRKDSYTMTFEKSGPRDHIPRRIEFDFVVDSTTDPMTIRQKVTSPGIKGFTRTVIFRIKDDKLEMSYYLETDRKDAVPKAFDGKKGSGQSLVIFKRLKTKKGGREEK